MASRETFKAGLFGICLNIEKKPGNHDLNILSKQLTHSLEIEPIYMKPAIRNMQAVLFFNMVPGRTKARLMLEKLIAEYPNDLNIFADLIYVNQKMGHQRDSDRYKKELELHNNDPLLRAKSILGQASALTYDLEDDYNKTLKALLKESRSLINMENKNLEQVNKANDLIVEAYNVVKTIPETPLEIDAKEITVEKFEKGIETLKELDCSPKEICVWKYNLAIARGRLDTWRCRRGDTHNKRLENIEKALQAHLDVIKNLSLIESLEDPLKIYVAKSCIVFTQLCWSCRDFVPPRFKCHDLNTMQGQAMSICPRDSTVMRMRGLYLYNKEEYLPAIEYFDISISLIPDIDINWFSYSCRSQAYYQYSILQQNPDKDHINKYLELAYKDAEVCLQSRCTVLCMTRMAKICFQRALPDPESGISFFCQHIPFIYEALENLHEALSKQDITKDSEIYSILGKYYPYIGQYRKAVEFLKKALEFNKWSNKFPNVFSNLCKCYMAFYEEDNNKNVLSEFRLMLKEAKKSKCHNWVTGAMDMMRHHNPKMLTDLIENMIENDVRSFLLLIAKMVNEPICQKLGKQFETKLQERNDQISEVNGPTEIQKSQSKQKFPYDFFVWNTERDEEWVDIMLLPQLEKYDDGIGFKGFVLNRDSVLGEAVLDNIVNGIHQSRNLLIVLTPSHDEDRWLDFVSNLMIFSLNGMKVKERAIIPIILERCDIPQKLQCFSPIFFTETCNWNQLRFRLTVHMDPEKEERVYTQRTFIKRSYTT